MATTRRKTKRKAACRASGAMLLRAVKEHRHRSAIYAHLASQVQGDFIAQADAPQYLIRFSDGSIGPADDDVVIALADEFAQRATQERERARQLLRRDIGEVDPEGLPQDDADAEDDDLLDETELNPACDPRKPKVLS